MRDPKRVAGALAVVAAAVLGAACLEGQGTQAKGGDEPKGGTSNVAATIGDTTITLDEVDREAMKASVKPYQELYDARKKALDKMIADLLLAKAAKDKGITTDELMQQEAMKRASGVTEEDIKKFYDQNQSRMSGRTLEQMHDQIRDYMQSIERNKATQAYMKELRDSAGVNIALDPPRVDIQVAANDPAKGPATAKVTIVEFSDFQ